MTKEELFEKYGDVGLKFSSYYKYTFSFKGTTEDGEVVYASVGGDPEDVYRLSVSNDEEVKLNDLGCSWVEVTDKDGKLLHNWTDPWW